MQELACASEAADGEVSLVSGKTGINFEMTFSQTFCFQSWAFKTKSKEADEVLFSVIKVGSSPDVTASSAT